MNTSVCDVNIRWDRSTVKHIEEVDVELRSTPRQTDTSLAGKAGRTPRVQSVDRAMLLLRAVAAAPVEDSTAARLAETCGINRATAWRILNTLEAHGIVSCSRETGRWSVGVAVVDIARSAGIDAIISSVRPGLERLCLQTGETAALAVARLDGLTYVDEVVPPAIVAATWLGQTVPLHATSTGKVLLAFSDPHVVPRMAQRGLERFTDTTITSAADLAEELATVRARGYATCRGEYEASAWGVSAPVLDAAGRLLAVLSIWGPGSRVTTDRFDVLGPLVQQTAATLLDGN
jgi:DNA-binding IclR family transcriptional regulator